MKLPRTLLIKYGTIHLVARVEFTIRKDQQNSNPNAFIHQLGHLEKVIQLLKASIFSHEREMW